MRVLSKGHPGYQGPITYDYETQRAKMLRASTIRNFSLTPTKNMTGRTKPIVKWAEKYARNQFAKYRNDVILMSQLPPYDYRTTLCNALANTPVQINGRFYHDPFLIRTAATVVWIEMTNLIDGFIGEKLDPDYINYLDRVVLSIRLRRVATYAELNFAYDYTSVLDLIYPVKQPDRWKDYPQSWGELCFCCCWRTQQQKFIKMLDTHTIDSDGRTIYPTTGESYYFY